MNVILLHVIYIFIEPSASCTVFLVMSPLNPMDIMTLKQITWSFVFVCPEYGVAG